MERIQFISQGNNEKEQLESVQIALDAGCRWVQLRCKWGTHAERSLLAARVKTLCLDYGSRLIINDDVKLARETDSDGVHLGLDDLPIQKARETLGDHCLIGGTANTIEDLKRRIDEGCDYIGLGPLRFTATKEKLSPILGIKGYEDLLSSVATEIPIIAIGGIKETDIEDLLSVGVYGVAISGAIVKAPHPKTLIERIHEKFRRHIQDCQ